MNQVDNQLEERLSFLENIVFVWGEYGLHIKTSPEEHDFLDLLECDGLIQKTSEITYKPTKEGAIKAIERRDRRLWNDFPIFKVDPIGGVTELIAAPDPFEAACDQTRYLMWDWMEYSDKHRLSITHVDYLNMWSNTFNRVWGKMGNAGVLNNDR